MLNVPLLMCKSRRPQVPCNPMIMTSSFSNVDVGKIQKDLSGSLQDILMKMTSTMPQAEMGPNAP